LVAFDRVEAAAREGFFRTERETRSLPFIIADLDISPFFPSLSPLERVSPPPSLLQADLPFPATLSIGIACGPLADGLLGCGSTRQYQ